jgi:hypothetical protein
VPSGVSVQVQEDAAEVDVRGAPGDVLVETDIGDVRVRLSRAPARIRAHSDVGDIEVSVPPGTYAVDAATDFGRETIRGLRRYDGALKKISAKTNVGDVTVQAR